MKAVKYLFALWAGLLVYVVLAVFFGPGGIFAHRQLEAEKHRLELNVDYLIRINRNLENTVHSLYDRNALSLYSREQGYALPHERFIRIVGLGYNNRVDITTGDVLHAAEPQYTDGEILRIIAFCTGITIMLCMFLFDFLKQRLRED